VNRAYKASAGYSNAASAIDEDFEVNSPVFVSDGVRKRKAMKHKVEVIFVSGINFERMDSISSASESARDFILAASVDFPRKGHLPKHRNRNAEGG
jgi:hypothetical protein